MASFQSSRLEERVVGQDIEQTGFLDDLPNTVLNWWTLRGRHGVQVDRNDRDVVAVEGFEKKA